MAKNTASSGLRAYADRVHQAKKRALYSWAQNTMTASKPLVPVETGTLRDSGFVEEPVEDGDVIRETIGYGGAAEEYAAIVHEDPDAKHPQGQWKYLEQPFNEEAPKLAQMVATEIQAVSK